MGGRVAGNEGRVAAKDDSRGLQPTVGVGWAACRVADTGYGSLSERAGLPSRPPSSLRDECTLHAHRGLKPTAIVRDRYAVGKQTSGSYFDAER